MKGSRFVILCAVLIVVTAVMCSAANHYTLGGWRNWSGPENGQPAPGYVGNAFMRVFVLDESGQPVKDARVWFDGISWGNPVTTYQLTDDRGHVEYGFQFAGSPCKVWITDNADGASSTSDVTPQFYNHDNHRVYEMYFVKSNSTPGWIADTTYCGDLLDMNTCPSTAGFLMNTPICSTYYSGFRDLASGSIQSFGQTFVANSDRAMVMRAHLTKGFNTYWRWSAQLFEGGPDGPPMGPKKNLKHEYISDDIKYFLSYGTDECALKPGNTYYVKFTAVDGSDLNAYRCTSDVFSNGTLYQNDLPVSGMDLQCQVLGISSGNSSVGAVSGTVTNAAGQPINEATIIIGTRRLLTGKLGTYKCYNIAPGTYNITVTAPGYESKTVTNRVVVVGGPLSTDIVLDKTAGSIRVVSTTGASIVPGDTNVPMSMTVASTTGSDCFVNSATLTFWNGSTNASSYFTVKPNAANPTVIRGNSTVTYNFLVDCGANAPRASYTVQGAVDANINLQANGSFEVDGYLPDYTGPTGWDWNSDDPPSVARLSYETSTCYAVTGGIPATTNSATVRWIGKWADTGGTEKKQGLRVYWPRAGGQWRAQLNIACGSKIMNAGLGTGDTSYTFTANKYYQIDFEGDYAGVCKYTITPLQEPGKPVGVINVTPATSTSTGGMIKWGKMNGNGTEDQSCREITYVCKDASGNVVQEHQWLATSNLLPTEDGWQFDSSGGQIMVPGAPWSADTHFEITTLDKKEGSQCLRVMCSPTDPAKCISLSTGTLGWLPEYNRMQVRPLTTYKLSLWYKQTQYTVNPANLRIFWEEYDAAGNRFYYEPSTSVGYRPPFHWDEREVVSHGEWIYKIYTFTTGPNATTGEILMRMDKPSTAAVADVFWFDDFRFMELNSYADLTTDTPGTLVVGGVVPVASIAEAKAQPDGTQLSLNDVIVTGSPAGEPNNFYVEDADRSSGIKVVCSENMGLSEGNVVDVVGTLDTVDGERILIYESANVDDYGTALKPLALNAKALGGAQSGYTPGVEAGIGLNNVGLLVTIAGRINNAGTGYLYANDGSGLSDGAGTGVKVFLGDIPMQTGKTFVTVTGFSSVENVNGTYYRVIKPRTAVDIVWY